MYMNTYIGLGPHFDSNPLFFIKKILVQNQIRVMSNNVIKMKNELRDIIIISNNAATANTS